MTTTRTRPDPDVNLPFTSGAPGTIICLACMTGGHAWEFGRNWVHQHSEMVCPNCGAVEDQSFGRRLFNFMAGEAYIDAVAEDD